MRYVGILHCVMWSVASDLDVGKDGGKSVVLAPIIVLCWGALDTEHN